MPETYNTGVGYNKLYYGTGQSAGYDPGAYYMYGAPEGLDEYNKAKGAYETSQGRLSGIAALRDALKNPETLRMMREDSTYRDQLAFEAGVNPNEVYEVTNNIYGRVGGADNEYSKKLLGQLDQKFAAATAETATAKAAADAAKGLMTDPFQKEMDRQMGMATDFRQQATDAQGRQAVQMDRTDFDADRARELLARQGMETTEGTLRDWVAGKGPSAAQSQFQSGLDQSIASQMAMANSARGGGFAQAAARQSAGAQGALQRMQGVSQAASLRAQEMQSAMGQLQSQGYNIRAQDQNRTAQGAEWADAQSRLSDAQKARNDLMSQYYGNQAMGYEGMRQQGYQTQAGMRQQGDQARQQDFWMQRQFRQGMEKDKADRDSALFDKILGIGGKVISGAATVAGGALGGPAGAAAAGALTGGGGSPAAPATVASSGPSHFTSGGGAYNAPTQAYGGFNTGGYKAPGGY